jgi:hypothetical protein
MQILQLYADHGCAEGGEQGVQMRQLQRADLPVSHLNFHRWKKLGKNPTMGVCRLCGLNWDHNHIGRKCEEIVGDYAMKAM